MFEAEAYDPLCARSVAANWRGEITPDQASAPNRTGALQRMRNHSSGVRRGHLSLRRAGWGSLCPANPFPSATGSRASCRAHPVPGAHDLPIWQAAASPCDRLANPPRTCRGTRRPDTRQGSLQRWQVCNDGAGLANDDTAGRPQYKGVELSQDWEYSGDNTAGVSAPGCAARTNGRYQK